MDPTGSENELIIDIWYFIVAGYSNRVACPVEFTLVEGSDGTTPITLVTPWIKIDADKVVLDITD